MDAVNRTKSASLFEEAKTLFPGGVNSPVRAFKSVYGPPLFIEKGDGPYLFDVDGNRYIDFCCSWGPLILGHNDPRVKAAVHLALENGTSFGAPSALGNELGKFIIDRHPYIDKLRFVSSGTEAVMSAVRLARGFTGKNKIIKFDGCYHGHVDSLLVKAGSGLATFGVSSSAGIPESLSQHTIVLPLDHLAMLSDTIEKYKEDLAAVVIEPIPANNGLLLQQRDFLQLARDLCDKHGVILIFDEVISGFRVGFEGAAGYYQIAPDLLTFGKVIGGGMPVGAFGGKAEIMGHIAPEGNVYQAGTLSANPIAMAAGLAQLKVLIDDEVYPQLEALTRYFVSKIRSYASDKKYPFRIQQIGSIFWFVFGKTAVRSADQISSESSDLFKQLHAYLLDHRIYLGPSAYEVGFISAAHDKSTLKTAAETICNGLDALFTE